jgi:hypothetical protein
MSLAFCRDLALLSMSHFNYNVSNTAKKMTLAVPKSTPLFTSVDLKGWHRYSINKIIVAPTPRAAEARINTQI